MFGNLGVCQNSQYITFWIQNVTWESAAAAVAIVTAPDAVLWSLTGSVNKQHAASNALSNDVTRADGALSSLHPLELGGFGISNEFQLISSQQTTRFVLTTRCCTVFLTVSLSQLRILSKWQDLTSNCLTKAFPYFDREIPADHLHHEC